MDHIRSAGDCLCICDALLDLLNGQSKFKSDCRTRQSIIHIVLARNRNMCHKVTFRCVDMRLHSVQSEVLHIRRVNAFLSHRLSVCRKKWLLAHSVEDCRLSAHHFLCAKLIVIPV